MKEAGCVGIDFGVDHGDEGMLAALGRSHTAADLRRAAEIAREFGFSFMFDLLLGGPGESRETLRAVIDFMKEIKPPRVGISLGVRVYPETPLGKKVRQEGVSLANPNLRGAVSNNHSLLQPIFYLSEHLGDDVSEYVAELTDGDKRFFFVSREQLTQNYNYNNNQVLVDAIAQGYRGAFWDILRRVQEGRE